MRLRPKPYVVRLYLGALAFFLVLKLAIRPLVAGEDLPLWLEVLVYSSPNSVEAIVGMCNGVGLLLLAKHRLRPRFDRVPERALYLLAAVVVAVYVLTQEVKLHDLGGRNLYDPYDVGASVVGILGTLALFWRFGAADELPRETARRSDEEG